MDHKLDRNVVRDSNRSKIWMEVENNLISTTGILTDTGAILRFRIKYHQFVVSKSERKSKENSNKNR